LARIAAEAAGHKALRCAHVQTPNWFCAPRDLGACVCRTSKETLRCLSGDARHQLACFEGRDRVGNSFHLFIILMGDTSVRLRGAPAASPCLWVLEQMNTTMIAEHLGAA
jgi:hypothetical protein